MTFQGWTLFPLESFMKFEVIHYNYHYMLSSSNWSSNAWMIFPLKLLSMKSQWWVVVLNGKFIESSIENSKIAFHGWTSMEFWWIIEVKIKLWMNYISWMIWNPRADISWWTLFHHKIWWNFIHKIF
jgi:hypothetical protein